MKYQSRCIVVLSVPRSGSSCVAGLLHRLGVDMGTGHLQPPDALNPRGYYEDCRWKRINNAIVGRRYEVKEIARIGEPYTRQYQALIQQRSKLPVWGFKDPRACFILQHIIPLLKVAHVETRIVAVERDRSAVLMSLIRHSRLAYRGRFEMSEDEARALLDEWQAAYERRLEETSAPIFYVNYDELLHEPTARAGALTAFCFSGLDHVPSEEQITSALEWLAPELNHYADNGDHTDAGRTEGTPDGTDGARPGWHAKRKSKDCNCG